VTTSIHWRAGDGLGVDLGNRRECNGGVTSRLSERRVGETQEGQMRWLMKAPPFAGDFHAVH
jgi:hypothetical protein